MGTPPWFEFVRTVAFTVVGLGGIIYEASRTELGVPERPVQMLAYMGLLGLNVAFPGSRKNGGNGG